MGSEEFGTPRGMNWAIRVQERGISKPLRVEPGLQGMGSMEF